MTVEEFNDLVAQAYAVADSWEVTLQDAYENALKERAADVVSAFETATLVAAWTPPIANGLPTEMTDEQRSAVDEVRDNAAVEIAAIFAAIGVGGVGATIFQAISDRGATNFTLELLRSYRAIVQASFDAGETAEETAAKLMARFEEVAPATARMLAQTELTALVNERSVVAAAATYGDRQAPVYKVWRTVGDNRVRTAHASAEGQTVPLDGAFEIGGFWLNYPGDPAGPMRLVANCRCRLEYSDTLVASSAYAPRPDVSGMAMVALYPRSLEARVLEVPGGNDFDTLHCTLVFLGASDSLDMDLVNAIVQGVAARSTPLAGNVGGIGAFSAGEDGYPVLALPDVQGLSALRETVAAALAEVEIVSPSEHGWMPHMTLRYADAIELGDTSQLGESLHFDYLSVVVSDVRTDYRLGEQAASAEEDTLMAVQTKTSTSANSLTAGITITIDSNEAGETEAVADPGAGWKALLAIEGQPTEDGRLIEVGALSWRELPLTMMAMTETGPGGHEGAQVAGRIDSIYREGENEADIWGAGVFDTGEYGQEIQRMVGEQTLRGNSVDLAVVRYEYRNAETGEVLEGDALWDAFFGDVPILFVVLEGIIIASTICPTPAINGAEIMLASGIMRMQFHTNDWVLQGDVLTAGAAGMAPLHPPAAWFDDPQLDGPTGLTVTKEGHVFGHAALFDTCHIAEPHGPGICVPPPRSGMAYSVFHHGMVETDEGYDIPCGQITLGTTHAGRDLSWSETMAHYEDSGRAVADVQAGEDQWGIWVSGALRPDVPAEKVREMKAGAISGDWRQVIGRGLEFLAALVVNVPGFPIPRPEARVVASAAGEEVVLSLVAAGMVPAAREIEGMGRREYLRKIAALTDAA